MSNYYDRDKQCFMDVYRMDYNALIEEGAHEEIVRKIRKTLYDTSLTDVHNALRCTNPYVLFRKTDDGRVVNSRISKTAMAKVITYLIEENE